MMKIGNAELIDHNTLNCLLNEAEKRRSYERIDYDCVVEHNGLQYEIWFDRKTGKRYACFKERSVYFGLNDIPQDKVDEFTAIVEREGICKASWSCTGRTLHHILAMKLQTMLPQYDFEIDYDGYKCIARKNR